MGGGGNELQRLSSSENFLLGLTAGMGTKAINYPLLHCKNRAQQGLPISFNPYVIYRGLPMAMLNLGGTTAVQFGLTGFFQKTLRGSDRELSREKEMGGAFLAGFFSGIPCSMYELTMIQQQRFGGSVLSTPLRIMRDYGKKTIFRGTTMTMGRESLYTMAMLGGTPLIQRELRDTYNVETSVALAAGSFLTAVLSVTITHPMDTIKTCMQGDVAQVKYSTVLNSGRALVEEYGVVKGLFKGLTWRIALISTTIFIVNNLKITIAPVLFPIPAV